MEPGVNFRRFLTALTGHSEEVPSRKILSTLTFLLCWSVLDHLMITKAPRGGKIMSVPASCWRGSYEFIV